MFCPGRNMRNLDKNESRRTDQSGRSAGAPILTGLPARGRGGAGCLTRCSASTPNGAGHPSGTARG